MKKCHFFGAKNGLLEENPMSPESEPRLMWLPNAKIIIFQKKLLSHEKFQNFEKVIENNIETHSDHF